MNAQLKNFDSSSLPDLEDPTESMPEECSDEIDFGDELPGFEPDRLSNDINTFWDRELADELA